VSGNSGTTPRCLLKYVNMTSPVTLAYIYPRYGWFTRNSIVSSVLTPTFGNRPARTDTGCAAGVCTYAAESQNYAIWYSYYRKRMQMMKTATGRAFINFISNPSATPPKPDTLRVGFITINPFYNNSSSSSDQGSVQTSKYLKISNFNAAQASSWYNKLYAIIPDPSTPLRLALSRAGWIFAGKLGVNGTLTEGIPAADDPMQASCQRNFNILTTDGFWNQGTGIDLAGNTILNQDSTDNQVIAPYTDVMVSRSTGTYDGGLLSGTTAGASPGGRGTLADIALYYYKTDLRGPGAGPSTSPNTTPANGDVATNNVPAKPGNKDFVTHQHMNTYTLGLADGLMRYQADYETSATGDLANIKSGAVGACYWAPGATCNWPSPQENAQTALDDLWHAAVNGRGTFYLALNANALSQGLSSTLNNLNAVIAAAAASATSSPNITPSDNQIFSTTYQTNTWSGRVFAQTIDPITGNVNPAIQWRAEDQIVLVTGSASDTRRIFTVNPLNNTLMNFTWANIQANTATNIERTWFQNKCNTPSAGNAFTAPMTQCSSLSGSQTSNANDGAQVIGFLRGQFGNESGPGCLSCIFRDRQELDPVTNATVQTVLGDTIDAKPIFVKLPTFQYADLVTPSYGSFKASMASRPGRLYVGANDGYLHAFNSNTGDEAWGYAPRFLLQGMYRLADTAYSASHRYYVDGSPETGDVFDTTALAWKTIIIGGAGGGGRGYYALDITDADNPILLWEFCNDSTLCAKSDADLGFSYGNPVIGKRAFDGRWVVVLTSGLNNGSPDSGGGFFYVLDAITGAQLNKIPTLISGTNVGSTGSPSGLMKISGYYDNALADATFRYVYGGDNLGNIWRLDMSVNPPTLLHIATLKDAAARAQPITTRMALTHIGASRIINVGTGRYLGSADLSDPGAASGIAWQQSIYAIKDKDSDYGSNIRVGSNFVTQTLINATPTTRTTTTLPVDWTVKDGWLVDLNPGNTTPGERVNVDPELILGTLLVAANIPTTSAACTVGGESFLYQFDFKTGQYVNTAANGVAGTLQGGITVGMAVIQLPSGAIKDIVTTADTSKTSNTVNVSSTSAYLRRFSYRER
jgi:type IV pilus assembly protein PilY1